CSTWNMLRPAPRLEGRLQILRRRYARTRRLSRQWQDVPGKDAPRTGYQIYAAPAFDPDHAMRSGCRFYSNVAVAVCMPAIGEPYPDRLPGPGSSWPESNGG